jgi:hypothetical protein
MPSATLPAARLAAPGSGGRCDEYIRAGLTLLICDQGSAPHGLHHDPFDRLWWKRDDDAD